MSAMHLPTAKVSMQVLRRAGQQRGGEPNSSISNNAEESARTGREAFLIRRAHFSIAASSGGVGKIAGDPREGLRGLRYFVQLLSSLLNPPS
jgi:hypothetical protein